MEAPDEKEEILTIGRLADESLLNNFESYNSQLLEIIRNFENLEDKRQFAKYYFFQGEICHVNNVNLLALVNFFKALDFIENGDSSFLSFIINIRIGLSYYDMGSFQKASRYLENGIKIYTIKPDDAQLILAYMALGKNFKALSSYDKAMENYKNALQLSEKTGDKKNKVLIELEIGKLYLNMARNQESFQIINEALKLSKSINFFEGICSSYLNLAEYYKNIDSIDKSIEYIILTNEMALKYHLDDYSFLAVSNLTKIYLNKQDYMKAKSYALANLKNFGKTSQYERRAEIYKDLFEILFSQSDYKNAAIHQKEFLRLKDTVHYLFKQKQALLSDALQNYEVNIFQKRISEKEDKTKIEELNLNRNLLYFVITILILLVPFIINLIKTKNRIKADSRKIADQNRLIMAQSEEISIQNDDLNKYKNNLELLIEERTAKLNETLRKAQESDRLKSSFLTNISHEIRTPMNAIIGFAQLLEFSGADSNSQNLEIIVKNSYELLKTVESIVELAKIQSEPYHLDLQELHPIQLRAKLETEANRIRNSYLLKDIEFKLAIPEFDEIFSCDLRKLVAILIHLLENAYKYTEKGTISLECIEHNENFEFKVCDTGIGIAEKEQPHIFDVFYKVENQSRLARGTGIGLAIVKKLIDILKGRITVDSELGKGASFSLFIPKKQN